MRIFSIDPSVNDVGWASIDGMKRDDDGVWDDSEAVWRWGWWKLNAHSYRAKLEELKDYIALGGSLAEDDILVGEWPAFFDNQRGAIAAKQGYTIDLAGILCYIAGYFRIISTNIYFITAIKWKGSVPKEVTRLRFFKALGVARPFAVNHNAVDAVMLLLEFCRRNKITFRIVPAPDQQLG